MDVLGASEKLAICAWIDDGGSPCEEIFPIASLRKVAHQMQQQPRADDGPKS